MRRRLVSETDPDGRALRFAYDAHGNRTAVTAVIGAQSLTTTTTYDPANRPLGVIDPLGRSFSLAYDAAGNRTSLAYPNTTATSYTYDALDRLTHLVTTQGPAPSPLTVQSYAYTLDADGKRTQVAEADGTSRAYGYDSIDRLTSEDVTGSLSYTNVFSYDPAGNRLTQDTQSVTDTTITVSHVGYAYDTRDRLTTENGTPYSYDANGNVVDKSGEATYSWDPENRLTLVHASGATVAHSYDPDGNRVQTRVAPTGGSPPVACNASSVTYVGTDATTQGNWRGTYGADGSFINAEPPSPPAYANMTVSATGTAGSYTWANYTGDVRALQQPPPGTSRIASTWYTTANETIHVTFNDNLQHTIALYLLDWDLLNRTQTITAQTPSGTVLDAARPFASFQGGVYALYSVCGSTDFVLNRTGPNTAVFSGIFFDTPAPATTTQYLVDTSGGLSQNVVETDGSGNIGAYYVRVGDELLEEVRPGATSGTWTTRFVHSDGLGSVRTLTDETGAVIDTRAYEAFGTKNVEAGSDPLTYGFAGEPFEPNSHLAYHRARWMDARVGRFLGMDPFPHEDANHGVAHSYGYASNEPTDRIDPTGRVDLGELGAVVVITGFLLSDAATPATALFHAGGQVYANLRAREAGGIIFSHLYIEYVDKRAAIRSVFEAEPNYNRGTFSASGLLIGEEHPWGVSGSFESDDDDKAPIDGVSEDTYKCLKDTLARYNQHPVKYNSQGLYAEYGHNSNWWAVNMCSACKLEPLWEPGFIVLDDKIDPAFGQ